MPWITTVFDKTRAFAALTAALGCASGFSALAALGASLGLAFLAQHENIFVHTLMPVLATLALAANIFSFYSHKIWYRTLAGVTGPLMVLLTMYPLWFYDWSTYLLYSGIALMLMVSILDIVSPPQKFYRPDITTIFLKQ